MPAPEYQYAHLRLHDGMLALQGSLHDAIIASLAISSGKLGDEACIHHLTSAIQQGEAATAWLRHARDKIQGEQG